MRNVTIRIWLDINDKFGHATLQTGSFRGDNSTFGVGDNGIYVSIYPEGRGVALTDRTGVPFKTKTLDQDLKKYGKPDVKVVLRSLDSTEIENEYKHAINKGFNFSLMASTVLRKPGTHNCTGLVYHLLVRGKIDDLLRYDKIYLREFGALLSVTSVTVGSALSIYTEKNTGAYLGTAGLLAGLIISYNSNYPDALINTLTISLLAAHGWLASVISGLGVANGKAMSQILPQTNVDKIKLSDLRLAFQLLQDVSLGKNSSVNNTLFITLVAIGILSAPALLPLLHSLASTRHVRDLTGITYFLDLICNQINKFSSIKITLSIRNILILVILSAETLFFTNQFNIIINKIFEYYYMFFLFKATSDLLFISEDCMSLIDACVKEGGEAAYQFYSVLPSPDIATRTKEVYSNIGYDPSVRKAAVISGLCFGVITAVSGSMSLFFLTKASVNLKSLKDKNSISPYELVGVVNSAEYLEQMQYGKKESKKKWALDWFSLWRNINIPIKGAKSFPTTPRNSAL